MKLFLHLEIGDWQQRGYDKAWLHFASSLSSDILGTDIDNQSDAVVADLVLKLIDQSTSVFALIEVYQPEASPGAISKVVSYLVSHSSKISTVVLSGNHAIVEKQVAPIGGKLFVESDVDKIQNLIKAFAQ